MALELGVWRIDSGVKKLDATGLDLESRLEDIVHQNIQMLSPNWMVIGRQVQTSYNKRIDLLCIDRDGNLIVIELKRDMTERETVAQVLDYGSWVRILKGDEIARIFDNYRKAYLQDQAPISIDEAFCTHFKVKQMPEDLNEIHELVIIGSSFDPATERIVGYLASLYKVRINAVFFRVFKDESREYLTRFWLREPTEAEPEAEEAQASDWNNEYYVSFGRDPDGHGRNWEDATKYGFISGGGGNWYSQTLRMLQKGDRVWVNVPGGWGYVGVGIVEAPSVPVDEFMVKDESGKEHPILELPLKGFYAKAVDSPEKAEYLVRVKWIKTVPISEAVKERGFFGNQNTVARPVASSWTYTIQRLKQRFGLS